MVYGRHHYVLAVKNRYVNIIQIDIFQLLKSVRGHLPTARKVLPHATKVNTDIFQWHCMRNFGSILFRFESLWPRWCQKIARHSERCITCQRKCSCSQTKESMVFFQSFFVSYLSKITATKPRRCGGNPLRFGRSYILCVDFFSSRNSILQWTFYGQMKTSNGNLMKKSNEKCYMNKFQLKTYLFILLYQNGPFKFPYLKIFDPNFF